MEQSTLDNGASEHPSYCNTSLHEALFATRVISMDLLLRLLGLGTKSVKL